MVARLRAWEDVSLVVKSLDPEGSTLDASCYDARAEELRTLLRYVETEEENGNGIRG